MKVCLKTNCSGLWLVTRESRTKLHWNLRWNTEKYCNSFSHMYSIFFYRKVRGQSAIFNQKHSQWIFVLRAKMYLDNSNVSVTFFHPGLATASVYCDGSLRKSSFPFECHRNFSHVVAVKSHWRHIDKFPQVILILRNPVNTLLAFFNYRNAGHTGTAPASAYAKSEYLTPHYMTATTDARACLSYKLTYEHSAHVTELVIKILQNIIRTYI